MSLDRSPIFAGEPFSDYANRARIAIKNEVKNQSPRYNYSTWQPVKDRDQLLKEQTVPIPQITSTQARVRGDEIEYTVRFNGANGTFFRFRPSNEPGAQRPVGIVTASALLLYVENSGDASSIKDEWARQFEQLNVWYETVRAEVDQFNHSLTAYLDEVVSDHEDDERKMQALEDELNS